RSGDRREVVVGRQAAVDRAAAHPVHLADLEGVVAVAAVQGGGGRVVVDGEVVVAAQAVDGEAAVDGVVVVDALGDALILGRLHGLQVVLAGREVRRVQHGHVGGVVVEARAGARLVRDR